MLGYTHLAESRAGFAAATWLMLFCLGGNFVLLPAHAYRSHGPDAAAPVYALLFSAFGLAAIVGPVVGNALLASGGFELVYKVLGALSLGSLVLAGGL